MCQRAHCALCFWAYFRRLASEQYSAKQAHADNSNKSGSAADSHEKSQMGRGTTQETCMQYCHHCEADTDSAAAAGFAKLQVHCIPLAQLNSYVAHAPLIFSPGCLLAIQHYVGPEPVHGDRGLQALVQIIQRCLQHFCSKHSDMPAAFSDTCTIGLKLAGLRSIWPVGVGSAECPCGICWVHANHATCPWLWLAQGRAGQGRAQLLTWNVTRKGNASEKAVSDWPPEYQPLAEERL